MNDKITYFYTKHIKRWMFCPSCEDGKMKFDKETGCWVCPDCGYHFSESYFSDNCIFWFCDQCDAYLNEQEGFDEENVTHVCTECGFENQLTVDNVNGVCSECGVILPDADDTLCEECREVKKEETREKLLLVGKISAGIVAVAGVVMLILRVFRRNKD